MDSLPHRWMAQQQQSGRQLCLMLEGNHEARQPLLADRAPSHYCNLYSETPAAELANSGPLILLLEQLNEPALADLLLHPESNWGWLASLAASDLAGMARHWRERLLLGPEGQQALYRFHDNRTLARALAHLAEEHWPVYLGPLISVCYWHEGRWCHHENPAPGDYPAPEQPPWLNTPNPQAEAILHANILRYLLAEHSEDLVALVEFQDPRIWLAQVLEQARIWQWREPEQLEFLVVRRLAEATGSSVVHWQPRAGEAPGEHFERVAAQWRREVGSGE
ncbi:DUF4123 domain-containing protein [Pseudomonas salmasensis]|uniref:DUF4123 domain-containing protein n=1 Tax=Pseudomonas salmasensis TaxID=2745514 RepID=UPI001644522E|nr:DUF4123 domain-containing protein [Pseudomonas salmasensis]QXH77796.1 DUF4123 domain-containing protein [Pseudomonas salmasensis]